MPDSFSIIGYDNLELSEMITPPLTTVDQPYYDISWQAAKLLLDFYNSPSKIITHIELPGELLNATLLLLFEHNKGTLSYFS